MSVSCSLVVIGWERVRNLLAFLNVMYSCVCLFPIQCIGVGVVGVLIPDLCLNSQGFFT